MNLKLSILFVLVSSFCFPINSFALDTRVTDNREKISGCVYIAPHYPHDTNLSDEIKMKSVQSFETFSAVTSFLHKIKDYYHQFYFRYPLQSAEHAKKFAKIMQIKAQEAHKFVPVIADSQFIEPRNLGFSRRIVIADGPIVQEHVLIDAASNSIIFVEEFAIMPDGKVQPGAFVALNSIIEEEGSWFFCGVYLYGKQPTDEQIQARETMFRLTYENMIDFINNNDVDEAFNKLKSY